MNRGNYGPNSRLTYVSKFVTSNLCSQGIGPTCHVHRTRLKHQSENRYRLGYPTVHTFTTLLQTQSVSLSLPNIITPINSKSPQDEQTHFGHPIIASTCKSFYFDRWLDISTSDRDTFQGSVPKSLVALVGAVVCFPAILPA